MRVCSKYRCKNKTSFRNLQAHRTIFYAIHAFARISWEMNDLFSEFSSDFLHKNLPEKAASHNKKINKNSSTRRNCF